MKMLIRFFHPDGTQMRQEEAPLSDAMQVKVAELNILSWLVLGSGYKVEIISA